MVVVVKEKTATITEKNHKLIGARGMNCYSNVRVYGALTTSQLFNTHTKKLSED